MDLHATTCPCTCHTGHLADCSINGGCGHLHRAHPDQRCRRGIRCGDAERITEDTGEVDEQGRPKTIRRRVGAWAERPGGLCRLCTSHVRHAAAQLPADHAELHDLLGEGPTGITEYVSSSPELPVPVNLGIEALAAAIVDELERWAEPVAELDGAFLDLTGSGQRRAENAAAWLRYRVPQLLQLPTMPVMRWADDSRADVAPGDHRVLVTITDEDGVDGALALVDLHDRVRALAGRTERATRLWAYCTSCGRLALERPEGTDQVNCRICHHSLTWDEYVASANVLARAYGASA